MPRSYAERAVSCCEYRTFSALRMRGRNVILHGLRHVVPTPDAPNVPIMRRRRPTGHVRFTGITYKTLERFGGRSGRPAYTDL